jgi:DNA-directed RNA polymerase subunit M/transcription elongation factor TFIIS
MRFCPVCSYYLYLHEEEGLHLNCKHCGHTEPMKPTNSTDALVLETTFNKATNAKQTVSQLNAYTKLDPTLPRLTTIACPNTTCPSNPGNGEIKERNILYIKTDAKNLKYQYACTVCEFHWGS